MPRRHVEHLLIGGGLASVSCAEALRQRGAEGEIVLVGREPDPPYDRPPCSKQYLQGKQSREQTILHPPEWYEERSIELRTAASVMKLDPGRRVATLANGEALNFERALLATGANVRRLRVDGSELEGIYYLRTIRNADAIREAAGGGRVVLVGGSYIASELAASLTELGSSCAMVMIESEPLSLAFGEQAGRFFRSVLEQHGIEVHGEERLERFEGAGGRVERVRCASGLTLEADAVVMGTGAVPEVSIARAAGLELGPAGGVRVDETLATAVPGIWAAGDIAEYRSVVHGGASLRIEHWDVAFNQGRHVAGAMLGERGPYEVVPYFFSDLSDWASLEYVGPAYEWEREVVRGSLEEGAFTIFYLQDGFLRGALAVGRPEDLQAARALIAAGGKVGEHAEALADLSTDLEMLVEERDR
jgi:3-phenylpropionate/trans-cinnamate dioxygenase ferredoxin reductase subunit